MQRLLISGFGDIARRAAPALAQRHQIRPLARHLGVDLDRPETLALEPADALLHCAPPASGETDTRTANLIAALEKARILPAREVYDSTSGVYGDCAGAREALREPSVVMAESRRLDNRKLKAILGLRLRYPTVHEGLRHAEALGLH